MDKSLARYIWKHTRAQQIWILIVVAVSMYTYFLSFDLPKLIINGPIQGRGFETPDATQIYLKIAFDLPGAGHVEIFPGIEAGRFWTLILLCSAFLLLVIINGAFKFYINTYKGRLGERMLRRIRFELVDRVLRFPPGQFKRVKPAELATMVKDEVEPLGGFIGDAFVQPALLGGQAITALVFILAQNYWLGLIAIAIVAVQLAIIPQMKKRLIRLGRERQLTARELSGRIGEIAEGIAAVHTHDTSNFERADIAARLGRIFRIRFDLYQWKFLVKFLNNFLAQVTPFLFYLIGGYQVLTGRLDVGQLVAVIAAYKDLPAPLKDLIDWDQIRQDVNVKYAQVYEQFNIDNMIEPRIQALEMNPVAPLNHPLTTVNLSLTDDSGAKLLERASIVIKPGELVAIVGTTGGGGEALVEAIARLIWPDGGKISVGPHALLQLPESITGRRMSYAASDAYLFQGSLRDNLLYGMKHAPMTPAEGDDSNAGQRKWEFKEAQKSGNPDFDINSDWIDYHAAGAGGPEDILTAIVPVLDAVLLSDDILDLGLRSTTSSVLHAATADRIVEARKAFRARLEAESLGDLVVPFQFDAYNPDATVSENLLFGAATGPVLADSVLASNPYFRSVLTASRLTDSLYDIGLEIAANAVELFRDLPPDHPFFQQLTFMTPDEIPEYQAILQRLQGLGYSSASERDRSKVITLSFSYVEPRHRFGILDENLMTRIVAARKLFHESLPAELKGSIEPYHPDQFNSKASLMDNILFGRVGHRYAGAAERIRGIVRDILRELELFNDIINVGLEFNAGVGGRRLTAAQRQKLNLARALVKRADYFILNRALSALDQQTQRQILGKALERAKKTEPRPSFVAVLSSPQLSSLFERVVVFDGGKVVGDGNFDTLMKDNNIFKGLL